LESLHGQDSEAALRRRMEHRNSAPCRWDRLRRR